MRTLAIILALGLGLGPVAPAVAEGGFSARIGADDDASIGTARPDDMRRDDFRPRDGFDRRHRRDDADRRRDDDRSSIRKRPASRDDRDRKRRRGDRRSFFIVPRIDDDDDDDDRIVVVPVPTPAPPAEPEAEPAEPPAPPDPRGPAIRRARGAATDAPFTVGEPLPRDVPHVALDWRSYGLPEPPGGLVYARVGRTVLLIDPATRLVDRVVGAEALAPEEG